MEFKDWITYGLSNKYLIVIDGKIKVTNNLNRDYVASNISSSSTSISNLPAKQSKPKATSSGDIEALYHQFIVDANVPSRISNGNGGWYNGNRFSNRAALEFAKIMKGGVDYATLVLSTKLYYAVTKTHAVTITNYICDGGWRTNYYEVINKAKQNQLREHVEDEIKGDSNTLDL